VRDSGIGRAKRRSRSPSSRSVKSRPRSVRAREDTGLGLPLTQGAWPRPIGRLSAIKSAPNAGHADRVVSAQTAYWRKKGGESPDHPVRKAAEIG